MTAPAHGKSSTPHLVIFGCGYIGRAVAEFALQRGVAVTALTRNAATATALRNIGVQAVVADLATDAWHAAVPPCPTYALNAVSSGGGGVDAYGHSYLAGMQSIVRWARARGKPGTFVYTSSTSVYPQAGGVRVTEDAELPIDYGTVAADRTDVLRATERDIIAHGDAFGRWFILRLAGIYGPERHHLLEQIRTGAVAGKSGYRLNLAHRDDVVAAIWACFTAAPAIANEVFNVADDRAAEKGEIVAWLAARLGLPVPTFTGAPAGTRRTLTPDRIIANEKLKRVLGWKPAYPTFREGYDAILQHAHLAG